MIDADKARFATVLHGLATMYGKDMAKESIQLWWSSMHDWTIEAFETAASLLLKQCEFMPKPFDFVELWREENKPSAAHAWEVVIDYAQHGSWRTTPHPNHLIQKAVAESGGWNRIANQSIEINERWTRREFCLAFDQFADHELLRIGCEREEINLENLNKLRALVDGSD